MTAPTVKTSSGNVRGSFARGIHAFKGVPYGSSTAGLRRFMPPAPPEPWTDVREATKYGPSCPQPYGATEDPTGDDQRAMFALYGMPAREELQGEDCLVLNIWTPGLGDDERRPVMVRIHGGAYVMGSGSWAWHDGTNLALRGDVVVVTVNHRLGALGFLHLGDIGDATFRDSGNLGMLDLVAALEWVRANIEAFGGDPGNVTIFGESGGGMKISTLLTMPAADGLFRRAIIQSGPGLQVATRESATATALSVLEELGVDASCLDELRTMPVERINAAQHAVAIRLGMASLLAFTPVLDDVVLPLQPDDALAAGASSTVPLLIGTVRHEATQFLLAEGLVTGETIPTIDDDALEMRIGMLAGERAPSTIEAYRATMPGASALDLYKVMFSDVIMRMPSITLAERKVTGGVAPVFMYLLTWESPAMDGFLGASHGLCVPLSMDNCGTCPAVGDYPSGQVVAGYMSEAWIAFARDGDPNQPDLPKWPSYSLDGRPTMLFDERCTLAEDPFRDHRIAWRA